MSIAALTNGHGPEAHRWVRDNYSDHITVLIEVTSKKAIGTRRSRSSAADHGR